ncbi:hypothetical protein [Pararhodonellum marinum]|uniref:hypothetical protein n=1 Tax=Pararhodonellum marinum TaxID=2755358 RepID=UPI00188FC94C|nr:hypothetical protein [Pararhodonellum marinum]
MKNFRNCLFTVFLFFALGLTTVYAADTNKNPVESKLTPAEIQVLVDRVEEIKNMDKSTLTKSERKVLRTELKEAKQEIVRNNKGVFLSAGAIILIIVLLIVLL